jgi:ribose transport system ATP-binding protein
MQRISRSLRISVNYQELSMVENLTVAENIFLARKPRGRFGLIDRARMDRETAAVLDRLQLSIDPGAPVSELSTGQKRMIEIPRALSHESRLRARRRS